MMMTTYLVQEQPHRLFVAFVAGVLQRGHPVVVRKVHATRFAISLAEQVLQQDCVVLGDRLKDLLLHCRPRHLVSYARLVAAIPYDT